MVRILAANQEWGWIIDCDTVWIRNPPSQWDHNFATLSTRETSAHKKGAKFWREHKYAKPGWNGKGLVNFPCLFPPRSAYGNQFAEYARGLVKQHQTKKWKTGPDGWNVIMDKMAELINSHNLQAFVHPWWDFSPTPAFRGQRMQILTDWFEKNAASRTRWGVTYPGTRAIFRHSYCIQVFFHSASCSEWDGDGNKAADQCSSNVFKILEQVPDSLLGKAWKHVQMMARS